MRSLHLKAKIAKTETGLRYWYVITYMLSIGMQLLTHTWPQRWFGAWAINYIPHILINVCDQRNWYQY